MPDQTRKASCSVPPRYEIELGCRPAPKESTQNVLLEPFVVLEAREESKPAGEDERCRRKQAAPWTCVPQEVDERITAGDGAVEVENGKCVQYAPRMLRTAPTVRNRILRSSKSDMCRT